MARSKRPTAGQLTLEAGAGRRRKGGVERAAEADLRELRKAESIPPGMGALEAAYRLVAREVDRTEAEGDRWGKLNAARELRATRERLGIVAPDMTGSEADEFWGRMSTPVRDAPEP